MPYSIQCHFDEATDRRIRGLWARLLEAGLPSRPIEMGHFPHLTLLFGESDRPDELRDALRSVEFTPRAFDILLVSLSTFSNNAGVAFLGPVVTQEFVAFHQAVMNRFEHGFASVNPLYVPHRWFAHCTVATRLSRTQISHAIEILGDLELPFSARCLSLDLVKYPESQLLESKALRGD